MFQFLYPDKEKKVCSMTNQQTQDIADLLENYGQSILDLVADLRAASNADFPEEPMMYRQNEGKVT